MPPAARIGDMHTCPMVTPGVPPIPHVGGPITMGCPTVLIGFMPAARVGDMAICVGPPDTIAKGSMTVIIGGQPAARVGDITMHGGVIVMGCPTVMIGDVGKATAETPLLEGRWESDCFGEVSLDVSHKWVDKEDNWAAQKWGDDRNNFKLANAGYSLSSGLSCGDGEYSFDVIKASAHFDTISAQAGKDWKYGGVEGKLKVRSVEAEAALGAEWSKKAKDIHAKIGASVDLVKAEIGGTIKIPCFGHQIIVGLGVEGQVGAAAEAKAYAGWSEKGGYGVGVKAKAGAGLGAGVNFSLGFK